MLEAQCAAWDGVTSAAVYMPTLIVNGTSIANADDIQAAKDAIQALHHRMDTSTSGMPSNACMAWHE